MSMGPQYERDELYADGVVPVADPAVVPVVQQTPVVQQPVVAAPVTAPLVQQPVVQPVVQPGVVQAAPVTPAAAVRQASVWRFDAAAVITVVFGVVLLLFGLIALVRAGTDGDWSTPVVDVAGFGHTAILGIVEIAAGLALMIAGFAASRPASMFFATVVGVGAFVAGVQSSSFDDLGIESSFAWLVVVGSLVVVAAQGLLPTVVKRRSATYTR